MTLVEKMARAMCEADRHDPDADWRLSDGLACSVAIEPSMAQHWRLYVRPSIAALKAMRDPTVPQFEAAWDEGQRIVSECGGGLDKDQFLHVTDRYYVAMIDAAIKEAEGQ